LLPGLHHGLWALWPLLAAATALGLALSLAAPFFRRRRAEDPAAGGEEGPSTQRWDGWGLALSGLVGLAAFVAWLVSPTSASGPVGMPRGFESGLRYLAPTLVLGLALLPAAEPVRALAHALFTRTQSSPHGESNRGRAPGRRLWVGVGAAAILVAIAVGYPIQRHYLRDRYANPTFTVAGLDAAFKWGRDVKDSRIATTSTRQYPFFGTDLSNHVTYLGAEKPHGGFEEIKTCPAWRQALDEGDYDYVITTFDREEPGNPPFPPQTAWTEGPNAEVILRKPPTVVFKLTGPLDPSSCPN
jgi:hypothetical protein